MNVLNGEERCNLISLFNGKILLLVLVVLICSSSCSSKVSYESIGLDGQEDETATIAINSTSAVVSDSSSFANIANTENSKSITTPNGTDKSGADVSEPLAPENTMQDIDNRVSWIKERIDNKWYEDHYEDDTVIFRYFYQGVEGASLTTYYLYYDERGKLIYAEMAHYRGALYSIFFHNDKLFHVQVGPFYTGGAFIDGDISDVQVVITEDSHYAFVLEDLAFCLSHAYH